MKFFVINLALSDQHAWKPGPSFNPWQPHCSWPGGLEQLLTKYLEYLLYDILQQVVAVPLSAGDISIF